MRASHARGGTAVATLLAILITVGASMPIKAEVVRTPPLVPSRGAYFGGYYRMTDWSVEAQKSTFTDLEAAMGRTLDIAHFYYDFNGAINPWRDKWHIENGRIPMISWQGYYTDQIITGQHDGTIARWADDIKALGAPVFLRWFWEMDDKKKAHWTQSPENFIAAWRRLHDIFTARGATNAVWVWCPNAWAFRVNTANQYYPGDAYVDWVCADGYNWGTLGYGYDWDLFPAIFGDFYEQWAGRKPLMVGETGAVEQGGRKGRWIRDLRSILRFQLPEIKALVYFSSADGVYDFRIGTSTRAYNGYTALAGRRYFNPAHPAS